MGKFRFGFDKLAVFAVVIAFMGLVLFAANAGKSDMTKGAIDIQTGDTKSAEEIQAELDAAGLDAGVELYINSNVVMLTGKTTANLLIQNSEHNKNDQQVYIYDSDDVLLYKSDIIPPGYKIESARLLETLEAGEYECRAEFHVLDSDKNDKAVINAPVGIFVLR